MRILTYIYSDSTYTMIYTQLPFCLEDGSSLVASNPSSDGCKNAGGRGAVTTATRQCSPGRDSRSLFKQNIVFTVCEMGFSPFKPGVMWWCCRCSPEAYYKRNTLGNHFRLRITSQLIAKLNNYSNEFY